MFPGTSAPQEPRLPICFSLAICVKWLSQAFSSLKTWQVALGGNRNVMLCPSLSGNGGPWVLAALISSQRATKQVPSSSGLFSLSLSLFSHGGRFTDRKPHVRVLAVRPGHSSSFVDGHLPASCSHGGDGEAPVGHHPGRLVSCTSDLM